MRFELPQKTLQDWKDLVLPKIPDLVYVVCNQDLYLIQRRDGRDNTVMFDKSNIELLENCLYQNDISVYKSDFEGKENIVFIGEKNRERVKEALGVYYR